MHVTVHYALSFLLIQLLEEFFPILLWQSVIILLAGIGADFDFLFTMWTKIKNHRMYFTHSVYIPLLLVLCGLLLQEFWIISAGIAYLVHILIDLIDWGTNFFYSGRIYGISILMQKSTNEQISVLAQQVHPPKWFFIQRYYGSWIIRILEISYAILFFIWIFMNLNALWGYSLGYILFAGFHGIEYMTIRNLHYGKPSIFGRFYNQ